MVERLTAKPRKDYKNVLWGQGFTYPDTLTPHGTIVPYWNENACYIFTEEEIDNLARATEKLYNMSLEAVEYLLTGEMGTLGYSPAAFERLLYSYAQQPPTLYGRFDLAYNPDTYGIKMFEYNAERATSLPEAGPIQALWKETVFPQSKQFNRLTEFLTARWRAYRPQLPDTIHFMHYGSTQDKRFEDWMNAAYMREIAIAAGYTTKGITVQDLRWDEDDPGWFHDALDERILACFKLYPWDKLIDEDYGDVFVDGQGTNTLWIEPFWRNLTENKMLSVALYRLFPDSEYILPAVTKKPDSMTGIWKNGWVEKPTFGEEGYGIEVNTPIIHQTDTRWESPYMFQQYCEPARFGKNFMVAGVWTVGDDAVALGVKESDTPVSDYAQRFTPHIVE